METEELQRLKNRFDIIGNDAELNRALETAVAVAPLDLTVLITGESGVGKENIPKIIHQYSRRKNGPFFAVNCGAIPEGTIDSELFGHEKGSFTGAVSTRKGYFEEANGGTLFLDEIGELPLSSQAKLLRVLQNGEYIKVGSSKVEKTDVRVIAATNVNLLHAVSQGKFRADLYYRLNAIQVIMPALRDRKEDIIRLFRKFSSDFATKYNVCKISLTHGANQKLMEYRWPGNIRQLKNVAEVISAIESKPLSQGSTTIEIDQFTLDRYMPKDPEEVGVVPVESGPSSSFGADNMSSSDKQAIYSALITLKKEIDDLKKDVELYKNGSVSNAPAQIPAIPRHHIDVQERNEVDDQIEPGILEHHAHEYVHTNDVPEEQSSTEAPSLADVKKNAVIKALADSGGNRRKAAELLGVSERNLYRWIKNFNLDA